MTEPEGAGKTTLKTPKHIAAWDRQTHISGYVMRSIDVKGRKVGELPRILGMDPAWMRRQSGAIYGLEHLDPDTLAAITHVGYNDERDPNSPESYNRPSLVAGQANTFREPSASLVGELTVLYRHHGGMIVKFLFSPGEPEKDKPLSKRYPAGAGIREFVLHRPTPFQRLWTFEGSDVDVKVP